MSILHIICYNGCLVTWTVLSLTTAWLHLVLYREHVHFRDYVWLLLVACTIFLYNRIHMEGWKPCTNRRPVWTLENFQWCAEPCFVGAAILRGTCLPLLTRCGKHKSLLS
jgi:hypothetical protein